MAANIKPIEDMSRAELYAEVVRLRTLINTPHTKDWVEATKIEAAHQIERWGVEHDQGKAPLDWYWLLAYLAGKAVAAFMAGDRKKGMHHIISSSAVLLNWHRRETGDDSTFQPGHGHELTQ